MIKQEEKGLKFQMNFNLKYGIFIAFLWVIRDGKIVSLSKAKLGQIYRHLVRDADAEISAPKFHSFEEFKIIASNILKMYSDFKKNFF